MKKLISARNVGTTLFLTEMKVPAKLVIKILTIMSKLSNVSLAQPKSTLITNNYDVQFVLQKLHIIHKKINVLAQSILQSLMNSSKHVKHVLLMKNGTITSRSV